MPITLDDLRCFVVARSLFTPTTLKCALHRLGFVQADPIRAPARAQDLTLRHRVKDYRAGDLERRYSELGVEEDLPLLWRDRVIGWGNLSVKNGELQSELGYVESHPPRDRAFKRELEVKLDRMRAFLGLES